MPVPERPWSLRRRLIAVTLAAAAVMWVVSAIALYALILRATAHAADGAMTEAAELLLVFAEHEYKETGGAFKPVVEDTDTGRLAHMEYQVWTRDRRLLLRSQGAPEQALSGEFTRGFSDQSVNGWPWRVRTLSSESGALQIQIGEAYGYRRANGHSVVFAVLVVALLCTAALCAALWIMVSRTISQTRMSAREIGSRSGADLSPLPPNLLPEEFAPLIAAINALLKRLKSALETEKRLTADASHELRTPLAAIKMHAQVARRVVRGAAAEEALAKLEAGIDRAARLVEQLLSAARVDPTLARPQLPQEPVDLQRELRELIESYDEMIQRKQLRLSSEIGQSRWIADPTLARILLRNLLDNALRYARPEGRVRVRYAVDAGAQLLEVSDDGPGIPECDRERVFDPFYRMPGSADTGSGLGLAIARHIADGLGGSIELAGGIDGKGVTVRVRLPLPSAQSRRPSKSASADQQD